MSIWLTLQFYNVNKFNVTALAVLFFHFKKKGLIVNFFLKNDPRLYLNKRRTVFLLGPLVKKFKLITFITKTIKLHPKTGQKKISVFFSPGGKSLGRRRSWFWFKFTSWKTIHTIFVARVNLIGSFFFGIIYANCVK